MNILFRADSSSLIGTGHIMRDLVLAKQYQQVNIIFATQNLDGNINHKIIESAYKLEILDSNSIDEVQVLIDKYFIDMIIIDHYGIDYNYEKQLKIQNSEFKIMVLDDTYERHYCDILLNHNISGEEKRYIGLVPKECELRCGSKYTLIRDEFVEEKNKKTIFLAMGGADSKNLSLEILKVLDDKYIKVHMVTTSANPNIEILKKYIKNKNIKLHINSNKLAKLMKKSDFGIVSSSVIVHEVLYMELPFIAIKTADNQKDIYEYLKNNGYSVLKKFNTKQLSTKVLKFINKDENVI